MRWEIVGADADARPMHECRAVIAAAHVVLARPDRLHRRVFARITDDELTGPAPFHPTGKPEASLNTLLQKAVCHEAYHAGQLGIGRRLVGRAGAIG